MNKIKIVLLSLGILFILFSCSRQQPVKAAGAAEPSTTVQASGPAAAEKKPGQAEAPAGSAAVTSGAAAEESSAAIPTAKAAPDDSGTVGGLQQQTELPQDNSVTSISIIKELIAAAGGNTAGVEKITASGPGAGTAGSVTAWGSAGTSAAAEDTSAKDEYFDSKRLVVITSPETISFYKSEVTVTGYFSGFPNFVSAGWELSGTEQSGELPRQNNSSFQFKINTAGMADTLAVWVRAADSLGRSAEELLVLVNDRIGPAVTISSPGNNSVYTDNTVITGSIKGQLKQAYIEIVGNGTSVPLSTDGTGRFSIPLAELPGRSAKSEAGAANPVIKITAEDYNLNSSVEYLALYGEKPAAGIAVESPAEGDLFNNTITVSGRADGFRELSWDIPDTGFSGTFKTENNRFSYPLRLSGLGSRMLLRVSGKTGDKTVTSTVRLSNNHKTPGLSITTPSEGDYYKDSISLKGTAGSKDSDVFETIKNLSWGIPGTDDVNNLIFFEQDGSFTLDLSLSRYHGSIPLEINLEDYNNNISRKIMMLHDGKLPPEIVLTLPGPDAQYGAFIDITGTIRDPYADTAYGGISGLSFEIASTENYGKEPVSGTMQLNEHLEFGSQIPATDITGNQQIYISVTAVNGNQAEKTVEIKKSAAGITSFSLKAEEGALTANWRPLQLHADYTLLLTDDGSSPEENNSAVFKNVSPPLIIRNIANGRLYSAKLIASTELGELSSSVKQAIPAGTAAFDLKASGEFRQIKLNWDKLPGADYYTIFRSDDPLKDFTQLTSGVTGSSFTDKDISFGKKYYYYITPQDYDYARSGYVSAAMLKAPVERVLELNSLSTFTPLDVDVTGNYAYTAAGDSGFRIVDITNPESLFVKGSIEGSYSRAVAVRGDYAYLACGSEGLDIINIMDPANPFSTGKRGTTDAVDVCLKDNFAIIADNESGIKIIDVKDSQTPERASSIIDLTSTVVFVKDNILFSNDSSIVHLFDIRDPYNPVKLAEYKYSGIIDILAAENTAYLLSQSEGLIILDITNPENPKLLSTFSLINPVALTLSGDFIYVAQGWNGMNIINVSNPVKPSLFDSLNIKNARALDVSEENVIVAGENGLSAVQAFLQGVSFVINKIKLDIATVGISLFKNLIFVPMKEAGFKIFNIDNPVRPAEIGMEPPPDYSGFSAVGNETLYLTTSDSVLSVFKINPLLEPVIGAPLSTVELPETIKEMSLTTYNSSDIISVCTSDGGVSLISEGRVAASIKSIDARGCVIADKTCYISDNRSGLMIYTLESLDKPELYSIIEIEGANFMLSDQNRLLIFGRKGVFIFDITDRRNPVQKGFLKTNYAERGVLEADQLYLAEGYKGLTVWDLKNPDNPRLLSECDTIYAADIVVQDDYAYITDGTGLNTVQIFIPDWLKK